MKINKLSFITQLSELNKVILEKDYSKSCRLTNSTKITLASRVCKRENQEDSLAISINGDHILLLVADGMGGKENGEVASYYTAKKIKEWFETQPNIELLSEEDYQNIITRLIHSILENIPYDSGTTLNMSIVCPDKTIIASVGDSRTYTIKDAQITLRTFDDSLAFKIFCPKTSEERDNLRFYRRNNILASSISHKVSPMIQFTTIKNDDYEILCHVTDGVSDILTEEEIRACCEKKLPAMNLVTQAISTEPIFNPNADYEFVEYIYPRDNATAIVYSKKKG